MDHALEFAMEGMHTPGATAYPRPCARKGRTAMTKHHSNPRLRQGVARIALAGMLALAAIGLSQCRMVTDTANAVNVQTPQDFHGRSRCVHQCNDKFKQAVREERRRHHAALKDCDGDRQCRKAEQLKHREVERQLEHDRRACKRNCYHEGSGDGGR
jgi:hypothetical protein